MAGLTDTGITIETIDSLLASMVADQVANISPTLNTEADSVLGQLNAIYAAALLELWELFEDIYQSGYADTASGQSLSYIAALTGTLRAIATKGTATVRFHGPDTTVIPAGTEIYVNDRPDSRFATIAEQTIGGDTFLDIACETTERGSSQYALAGEYFTAPNPPSGMTGLFSPLATDSVLGADEETDAELRIRREQELGRPGSTTVDAIRSDLLQVSGVDKAQVYENATDVVDVNGVPPHSIECLVHNDTAPTYDGDKVAQAVWDAKPAGTGTYGTIANSNVLDSAGDSHTVYYSEPVDIAAHFLVTLTYDANLTDGGTVGSLVKSTIDAWAQLNLSMGDDVIASDIVALCTPLLGVVSVNGALTGVGTSAPVSNTDLTITLRQVATVDQANIDVTATAS
jgi:uncharacterized phage protein gp47/JayE